jgi:phage shock protein PspC (stress-responsive transcriptional regulator)
MKRRAFIDMLAIVSTVLLAIGFIVLGYIVAHS